MKTWTLAEERYKGWVPAPEDLEELEPAAQDDFSRFFFITLPDSYKIKQMRELMPDITEQQIVETLEEFERLKKTDPLALDQSLEESGRQMHPRRTGANLEMALYIAQATGAFPYTNIRMRWKELLSVEEELSETAKVWSPLTNGFSSLNFKFLNNVDADFAYSLRREGRLESFRSYLRKVWKSVNGANPSDKDGNAGARFW